MNPVFLECGRSPPRGSRLPGLRPFPRGAPSLEAAEGCPSPAACGTCTFLTGAQLSYPCLGSGLGGGRGPGAAEALPGLPAPAALPRRHLAGPPRARPLPRQKAHGIIFESAQNSARPLRKSPYYSSGVGSKSGEMMHLRRSRCWRLCFW